MRRVYDKKDRVWLEGAFLDVREMLERAPDRYSKTEPAPAAPAEAALPALAVPLPHAPVQAKSKRDMSKVLAAAKAARELKKNANGAFRAAIQ